MRSNQKCILLGALHNIRREARLIELWNADNNLDTDNHTCRIQAYGIKMHVLLGGDPPSSYAEALRLLHLLPDCLPSDYDKRTKEENKKWLTDSWLLSKPN